MAITITNEADHLLIVPLNDGQSVYLAPGETSGPIEELQINDNEKLSKLSQGNLISTTALKTGAEKSADAAADAGRAQASDAGTGKQASDAGKGKDAGDGQ
ncbi:MAG: hypothetical protein WCD76_02750 [Pyrinomonadaceae bacterium]